MTDTKRGDRPASWMTIRETMAAMALQGLLANVAYADYTTLVQSAVDTADALLSELATESDVATEHKSEAETDFLCPKCCTRCDNKYRSEFDGEIVCRDCADALSSRGREWTAEDLLEREG